LPAISHPVFLMAKAPMEKIERLAEGRTNNFIRLGKNAE
jgi:hypothetical protein